MTIKAIILKILGREKYDFNKSNPLGGNGERVDIQLHLTDKIEFNKHYIILLTNSPSLLECQTTFSIVFVTFFYFFILFLAFLDIFYIIKLNMINTILYY